MPGTQKKPALFIKAPAFKSVQIFLTRAAATTARAFRFRQIGGNIKTLAHRSCHIINRYGFYLIKKFLFHHKGESTILKGFIVIFRLIQSQSQ